MVACVLWSGGELHLLDLEDLDYKKDVGNKTQVQSFRNYI